MRRILASLISVAAVLLFVQPATAGQYPDQVPETMIKRGAGHFVPIPDEVPHDEGVYVDNRIRDDLVWISKRFEIYVREGYSGHLPGIGQIGCHCHVPDSDHKVGLAVDIYPVDWDGRGCDRSWRPLTKLAHLVEPQQNETVAPFAWVGYDRDDNHGCGDHLHLSWNHAPNYKPGKASKWVKPSASPRGSERGYRASAPRSAY